MSRRWRTPRHNLLVSLTFDQLTVFRSLVQAGSFRRAADQLNLSESAISQRIRHLESVLGAPLFDRHPGSAVQLTQVGQRLVDFTDDALRLFDLFHADLNELKRPAEQASLVIASGPSFIKYRLLPLTKEFQREYARVAIVLRQGASPDEIGQMVLDGGADLGVYTGPVPRDLKPLLIDWDELLLVASPEHPVLEATGERRIVCLRQADFAISSYGANSRELIQRWASRLGLDLRIAIETANLDTLKEAVVKGLALAILPDFAIADEVQNGSIVVVDVEGLPLKRGVAMVADPRRLPAGAGEAFLEVMATHPRARLVADRKDPPG